MTLLSEQIPECGFHSGHREPAPRPARTQLGDLLDGRERSAEKLRDDLFGQVVPAPRRRVVRVTEPDRHGRTLADPDPAVRVDGDEDRILDRDLASGDPERLLQGD